MIQTTITTEGKKLASVTPVTASGGVAVVEMVWSVPAGDVTLDVQPDGKSAFIVSGAEGQVSTVLAHDNKSGLEDTVEVTATAALAVNLGLAVGEEVPK